MLKNFNIPIKAIDGTDMLEQGAENGKPISRASTLIGIVLTALQAPLKGDENLTGTKRCELIALALRIHAANGDVEISLDEATLIKNRVEKLQGLNHVVFYRLNEFLEAKESSQ